MLTFLFELDKSIPQKDEPRYDAYSKGFIEGDVTICTVTAYFSKIMYEGCRAGDLFRSVDGTSSTWAERAYEI